MESSQPVNNTISGHTAAVDAVNETLAQMRLSMDSNGSSSRSSSPAPTKMMNGSTTSNGVTRSSRNGEELIQSLQEELRRTKHENDSLTAKYNNLVGKLAAMRTSVEGKLQRDAV